MPAAAAAGLALDVLRRALPGEPADPVLRLPAGVHRAERGRRLPARRHGAGAAGPRAALRPGARALPAGQRGRAAARLLGVGRAPEVGCMREERKKAAERMREARSGHSWAAQGRRTEDGAARGGGSAGTHRTLPGLTGGASGYLKHSESPICYAGQRDLLLVCKLPGNKKGFRGFEEPKARPELAWIFREGERWL